MSSPIAAKNKNILKQLLINFHQKTSHNNRIDILAHLLAKHICSQYTGAAIRCLDVGCGDMVIAEKIAAIQPQTSWRCIDIHPLPDELQADSRWQKYRQFDGKHIPFADNSFDVVVFCDVLHHAQEDTLPLLREAARVGKTVVIKDHFEYGFYSRSMLKLMDFIGNWGYGIVLPERYFSEHSFSNLCAKTGVSIIKLQKQIDLYKHLPIINKLLKSQWQFIAVLQANK
jgi:SAM-dependent methyltransferase